MDNRIILTNNGHETGFIVGIGEEKLFFSLFRNGHTCHGYINLAGIHGREEGIKAHALNGHFFIAHLLCHGLDKIHVKARDFPILPIREFKRSKGRLRAYNEFLLLLCRILTAGISTPRKAGYNHCSKNAC